MCQITVLNKGVHWITNSWSFWVEDIGLAETTMAGPPKSAPTPKKSLLQHHLLIGRYSYRPPDRIINDLRL
jgi:hypothetical protein